MWKFLFARVDGYCCDKYVYWKADELAFMWDKKVVTRKTVRVNDASPAHLTLCVTGAVNIELLTSMCCAISTIKHLWRKNCSSWRGFMQVLFSCGRCCFDYVTSTSQFPHPSPLNFFVREECQDLSTRMKARPVYDLSMRFMFFTWPLQDDYVCCEFEV